MIELSAQLSSELCSSFFFSLFNFSKLPLSFESSLKKYFLIILGSNTAEHNANIPTILFQFQTLGFSMTSSSSLPVKMKIVFIGMTPNNVVKKNISTSTLKIAQAMLTLHAGTGIILKKNKYLIKSNFDLFIIFRHDETVFLK